MDANPSTHRTLSLPIALQPIHYVYILANKTRTTLYIGVTNDLERRVHEHRSKADPKSFASRYNLNRLVYFERFQDIRDAIAREKKLKRWKRSRKNELIAAENPRWEDLAATRLGFEPLV